VKVAVRQCPSIDGELVAAAVTGDAGAFTELYELHADRVFAQLTRLIGPVPDREDAMQQVFLALHRALPRFRGDSSLTTFLGRITINIAYDRLRRRVRLDGDPNPEDRVRRREELRHIFELLEDLTPNKRIAFVLVVVEGLSLVEAAELVGAKPEAVNTTAS
jgi:RNA polymerase sigma-70 factor (ECF subfamily)